MQTFTLYHTNSNIKTLEEFCKSQHIRFDADDSKREDKYQLKDFFDDNRENILQQMTDGDKRDFILKQGLLEKRVYELTADDLVIDMVIPCPLILVINKRFVTYTISAKHNTFQELTDDIVAFEDSQIVGSMLEDAILFKQIRRIQPKCSVIGFFKTLYYNRKESGNNESGFSDNIYQLKQNFTDISKYITNLQTNVGGQGGTFSFQLPHVPFYRQSDKNLLALDIPSDNHKDGLEKFMDVEAFDEVYNFSGKDSGFPVVKADGDTMDYWNWLISQNDIIFISFDEVGEIKNDVIAGHSFDMIGLVETVSVSRDANANNTVTVQGRDLMKLLSDDASLYFPCASVVDQGNFFDNTEGALRTTGDVGGADTQNGQQRSNAQPLRMPGPSGMVRLFREECNGFSIDFIIKVAISSLANMQVAPSEIFNSWGDRVTTFQYLIPNSDKKEQTDNQQNNNA